METDVSKERAKLIFKKAMIGVIVAIILLIIIASSTSNQTYQPQMQHSQEYLDLRDYHIDSFPRKDKVIQSTIRMVHLLYDFEDGIIDKKWAEDLLIEINTMEHSIMESVSITPPPDHIYELYVLFFRGVGELDKTLEYLHMGIFQYNSNYFTAALRHAEKAVIILKQYHDKVDEYDRRYTSRN